MSSERPVSSPVRLELRFRLAGSHISARNCKQSVRVRNRSPAKIDWPRRNWFFPGAFDHVGGPGPPIIWSSSPRIRP